MKKLLLILLALAACSVGALAQPRTVTGTVLSGEDGSPLIQAAVIVKGTQIGVATDLDGRYSIRVPNNDAVLIFSYAGMENTEVRVGNQSVINVTLQPELVDVDEVMVVAFGKTKKSAFTGSATEVTAKELEKKQVSNVVNALQGKVPGVTLSSGDSQPGTSPNVQIRGIGSFSSDTQPLYVVDGVPFTGYVNSINPADVESTVVLRDAASAALYGARAGNGVVLITTKSGKAAKDGECVSTNVNFTARVGGNFRGVPRYNVIDNPAEYLGYFFSAAVNAKQAEDPTIPLDQVRQEAYKESFWWNADGAYGNLQYMPFTVPGAMEDMEALATSRGKTMQTTWDQWFVELENGFYRLTDSAQRGRIVNARGNSYYFENEDWAAVAIRPGIRQEYSFSVSGRGQKLSHYFSLGYLDEQGYMKGSGFKRYTARLKADYTINKYFTVGAALGYTHTNYKGYDDTKTLNVGNLLEMVDRAAPLYPVFVRDSAKNILKDPSGNVLGDYGAQNVGSLVRPFVTNSNPYVSRLIEPQGNIRDIVMSRVYGDLNLPYGFKVTVNASYDLFHNPGFSVASPLQGGRVSVGGSIFRFANYSGTFNTQQLLNWSHDFENHHVDVLLGHEFFYDYNQDLSGSRTQLFDPFTTQINGAYGDKNVFSRTYGFALEGYFTRVNYDYAEKYFLSASFRYDGSSRFAKEKRWGPFGSIGLSWLMNKEDFMESTRSWLNMLKIKASYGMQGNDKIGESRYLDLYAVRFNDTQKTFSAFLSAKGNPFITWESSHSINAGFEASFLGNRLSVNVDAFYKLINDMIFSVAAPPSLGYPSTYQNIGDMSNVGVEFEIRGVPYQDKNVRVTLALNGSHVTNKILDLPEQYKIKDEEKDFGYVTGVRSYREGSSMNNFFLPHYAGVNEHGEPVWSLQDGTTTTDYKLASENKNKHFYGNLDPVLTGGFSASVDFFGFDFSLSLGYNIGGYGYDDMYQLLMNGFSSTGAAVHADAKKAWTPQNTSSNIPRLSTTDQNANSTSDRFLISRSYLSIDNITLGYTLPTKWTKAIKLSNLRVYFVCDNAWLFSARQGYDPRFRGFTGFRVMRTFSGGLSLSF